MSNQDFDVYLARDQIFATLSRRGERQAQPGNRFGDFDCIAPCAGSGCDAPAAIVVSPLACTVIGWRGDVARRWCHAAHGHGGKQNFGATVDGLAGAGLRQRPSRPKIKRTADPAPGASDGRRGDVRAGAPPPTVATSQKKKEAETIVEKAIADGCAGNFRAYPAAPPSCRGTKPLKDASPASSAGAAPRPGCLGEPAGSARLRADDMGKAKSPPVIEHDDVVPSRAEATDRDDGTWRGSASRRRRNASEEATRQCAAIAAPAVE